MGLFFENQRDSNQDIREQVVQQKTRYQEVGSKKTIGEQVIGGDKLVRERCGASNQGDRDWGVSDR